MSPNEISDDPEIGMRVLAYTVTFAPCVSELEVADAHYDRALAILRAAARTLDGQVRGLKKKVAGDWSWEYLSESEMGSVFTSDDRSALAAMCGATAGTSSAGGPVGSFPPPHDAYRGLWRS